MKETWKRDLGAAAATVGFYAVLFLLGVTCPIKFATGVSCPGCGMTRAWLCLLLGRPARALYYHPLAWLPPVALGLYLFRAKLPRWAVKCAPAVFGAVFCIVYLIRLLSGCAPEVVAFAPEKGVVFRLWAALAARM